MQVNYLLDEMAKSADHYGVNRQISEFYLGWRAACEAMAKRQAALSPPQPVAGWRERCVVEEAKHGLWNVHTATRSHFLGVCGDIWVSYVGRPEYDRDYGTFADKAAAMDALAACPTPPPGVQA